MNFGAYFWQIKVMNSGLNVWSREYIAQECGEGLKHSMPVQLTVVDHIQWPFANVLAYAWSYRDW